jgi:hypothetical protein
MKRVLIVTTALAMGLVAQAVAKPEAKSSPPQLPQLSSTPPQYYIEEYLLVRPEKVDWFIDYYEKKVVPVLQTCPGYLGWMISSYRPEPGKSFDKPEDEENAAWHSLGPPDSIFVDHAGGRYNEKERTNSTIHFHAMMKPTYNLIMHHYFRDYDGVKDLNSCFTDGWKKLYGTVAWDDLADNYFIHVQNHSDTVYRFEIIRGGYDGKPKKGMVGHSTPESFAAAKGGK